MTTTTTELPDRTTPAWFDEAKLGIFIHWNPAAIPAFAPLTRLHGVPNDPDGVRGFRRNPYAEMYENSMDIPGSPTARHHAAHYGDLTYDDFGEQFRTRTIPAWDPAPWADLFARAGARYVVLTTKTEDGFLLWPSAHPNPHKPRWQSERDVVGELADAVRARELRFGTYYSGGIDRTFGGDFPMTRIASLETALAGGEQYIRYADAHWRELIDRYAPCVMWNDYAYPEGADVAGLFRYYWKHVADGVVNNRFQAGPPKVLEPSELYSDFVTPEYSTEGSPELKWEACRGIGTSFGYNQLESDATYMNATELIHMLADVVARGGNLLINVGPTGAGEIPWAQAQRLLELGWWLRTNGEAIYATRPWTRTAGVTGDGLGVRYTTSRDAVHAIVLGTPRQAELELDVRLEEGAVATLAGSDDPLPWEPTPCGTRFTLRQALDERPAVSVRLAPAGAVRPYDET
ncbi:MAG: alpha-L-fucosidase [Conexibacter sp.]